MAVEKSAVLIGAGWLGLPLANTLLSSGYDLCILASSEERKKELEGEGFTSLRLDEANNLGYIPELAIVTLPPMRSREDGTIPWDYHQFVRDQIEAMQPKKLIVTSSTSVYPETPATYSELDALTEGDGIKLENLYQSSVQNSVVVRFGGLFGPGRHPGKFLSGKHFAKPHAPINFTHLNDAVNAVIHLGELKDSQGFWNVVHLDHPTKQDFYTACCSALKTPLPTFDVHDQSLGKTVDSSKLIQSGFRFQEPRLLDYLKTDGQLGMSNEE
jgi:nucleoside-diphosphate-sugar epimerase